MKTKRTKPSTAGAPADHLKEVADLEANYGEPMIRTQIYLSRREHDFLQAEAKRRAEPMAAIIRSLIDHEMEVPADAWTNNPMLRPNPADPEWDSPPDAAINHDHYLHGASKAWVRQGDQWVAAPPEAETPAAPRP